MRRRGSPDAPAPLAVLKDELQADNGVIAEAAAEATVTAGSLEFWMRGMQWNDTEAGSSRGCGHIRGLELRRNALACTI